MTIEDDEYDRALVAHVHPSGWTNPTPNGRYNLVVVGAGTAGLVAAAGAAGLGARVAIVERALMGGDCLNVGCVPSKGVIRAARAAYDVRSASQFGIETGSEPVVEFAESMRRMRRLRATISPNDSAERFRDLGVDVFLGEACFVAGDAVEVGGARLEFRKALIATGARAASLEVPGLAEAGYLTNESVFTLTECPRRLVVVGAGPIGCELAQAFARLGSDVTVVSDGPEIMPKEERRAAEIVRQQMASEGVRFVLSATLERVESSGVEKHVVVRREGVDETLDCDRILVAIGRTPNVDGLGLDAAGVRYGTCGVEVDDRFRTSNRRIFAAGDVCSRYKFTHAADAMARAVLRNAFFFGREKASALVMPWCTYTDPEVAHVGAYEHEAREAGYDAATLSHPLTENDRAILEGETEGYASVVYDRKTGRILGGTIVARHAGEMIGELTLAIATGQSLGVLSTTIHPYPTQAEMLKRIGDLYQKQRLTPFVKKAFSKWFEWTR